jgi:hypothetical protein
MKIWPFGKEKEQGAAGSVQPVPSAIDRLLAKDCNRDEFVLLFVKMLQEQSPDHTIQMIGEMALKVVSPAGKEATTHLDNAWISYSRDRENRRDLLERHSRVTKSMLDERDPLTRDRIVLVVKDSHYMSMFKSDQEPQCEYLCGDLWLIYAEDLPDKITTLKRGAPLDSGISDSELRGLALENLRRIMPAAERHGDGPWFLLTAGGDYTASLLLFDSLWDDLAGQFVGRPG